MSQEQIKALIEAIKSNPELQQHFANATSIEEAARMATDAGFTITAADIAQALASGNIELTDAELEYVAGGGMGQLIKSFKNGGESCGNAVQKLTCNII
jgi:predicted ribosomally synthesized peptide with nif11-like leader